MTYLLDRDQENRLIQDQCIEEIYLDGITDGADGRLPAMSEIVYLQGYCKGMEQARADMGLKITVKAQQLQSEMFGSQTEFPLLCGQCQYLNNGKCSIKDIDRNSSQYACDRVVVDSPF